MRKILLGAVTMAGFFVLTTSDAWSAQSNALAVVHAAPAYGIATNVYYHHHWHYRRWHHWHHWHHWRHWHHWHHWY